MKRLSDFTGEEAIEKSGELLDPFFTIVSDTELINKLSLNKESFKVIGEIMKKYKDEAYKMVSIVDDEPVTASNAFPRFFAIFTEMMNDHFFIDYFNSLAKKQKISTGSVTEITEGGEN